MLNLAQLLLVLGLYIFNALIYYDLL